MSVVVVVVAVVKIKVMLVLALTVYGGGICRHAGTRHSLPELFFLGAEYVSVNCIGVSVI